MKTVFERARVLSTPFSHSPPVYLRWQAVEAQGSVHGDALGSTLSESLQGFDFFSAPYVPLVPASNKADEELLDGPSLADGTRMGVGVHLVRRWSRRGANDRHL